MMLISAVLSLLLVRVEAHEDTCVSYAVRETSCKGRRVVEFATIPVKPCIPTSKLKDMIMWIMGMLNKGLVISVAQSHTFGGKSVVYNVRSPGTFCEGKSARYSTGLGTSWMLCGVKTARRWHVNFVRPLN
ncbi:hypothetical protein OSTOST_19320, partial [Ostertagia ostertagi]